ncbi:MAG: C-terminal target protein [Bacteroidetes bacterium]|nr:C-terminal target protein [Bacteroidota bacterium]
MKKQLLLLFILFSHVAFCQVWQSLADFPATERDDGVSFVIGNKAYCGTGGEPGFVYASDFYALNMNNDTWSSIAALPTGNQRQYSSGFSNAGFGFIVGGLGSGYLNDVWMYDTVSNSWSSKTPLPSAGRMGCASFVINGIAYIIGGRTSTSLSINEVWAYDMTNDTWQRKNDLPFGSRWRASATALANKGYLAFGIDEHNRFCNELFEYDPVMDSWTQISTFPDRGRSYAAMKAVAGDLLVTAGLDTLNTYYNDMWRYTITTSVWQQLGSIPAQGRKGGMCFTNGSALYYTTGIDQTNTRLKQSWKVENPTGIEEYSSIEKINAYPNPANGILTIALEQRNNTLVTIEIMDETGRIIRQEKTSDAIIQLDTAPLANGFYSLRIITGNRLYYSKVAVLH